MIAILGGLGAAVFFALATVSSSRSSRMVGPAVVLAWVVLVGSIVAFPAALLLGFPVSFTLETLVWLGLSGGGNLLGLLLGYSGLRVGKVGLVAPISSTEGAIAALIAVAMGEPLSTAVAVAMVAIVIGVVLTALAPDAIAVTETSVGIVPVSGAPAAPGPPIGATRTASSPRWAILLAGSAALSFGISLYATGRIGAEIPVVWAVVPARLFGVIALTVPLAARGRLAIPRGVLPFVVLSGLGEVAGFAAFTVGARDSIAVSAVLLSQFSTISVVLAWLLFGERLSRVQLAGIAFVVGGVATLAAVQP